MPCNPIVLGALADGELRGLSAWRMRRHLAHCPSCQKEMAELEALSAELKGVSPLPQPLRKPIRRPLGLIRPAFATLALASVAAFLMVRAPVSESPPPMQATPKTSPEITPQAPVKPPSKPSAAQPTQVTQESLPKTPRKRIVRRVARRKTRTYHRPLAVAKALPTKVQDPEQVIIVASAITLPKPVTIVLNDKDDEGGTIHIESTIPAAYVVALQKETK